MSRLPDDGDILAALPLQVVPTGTTLFRATKNHYLSPLYFSTDTSGRFNCTQGTLYLAETLTGAMAESIVRNAAELTQDQKITHESSLQERSIYEVAIQDDLQVLNLSVPELGKYRFDSRIFSEYAGSGSERPYIWGPAWAAHAHGLGLDGIRYRSRHHTESHCLALFGHTAAAISWNHRHTLMDDAVLQILEDIFDWAILRG